MLNQVVFNALNNPGNFKIIPGVDRILKVLNLLSNPQLKYKVIHITGTNGKGSTAAFIETGLMHAGFKVGKFTSPHIKFINECICLNGQMISDQNLELCFYQVNDVLKNSQVELSPFELLTVIMFNYFANAEIEYLVLEVGMGGTDDATNVVDSIISIITNISLEHTKFLGNTLEDIAKAKSGIIKNGLTIIADNSPELLEAVSRKTNKYINVLTEYQFTSELDFKNFRTILKLINSSTNKQFNISLFGKFQVYNFLVAYHCLKYLGISENSIKYAAENTKHTGRFEVREYNPLVIFDATHNLAGAENLAKDLKGKFKHDDIVIVTSILKDKDVLNMLKEFSTLASTLVCTSIHNNPRSIDASELGKIANNLFKDVQIIEDPQHALQIAKTMNKRLILITGSLYLLGCLK